MKRQFCVALLACIAALAMSASAFADKGSSADLIGFWASSTKVDAVLFAGKAASGDFLDADDQRVAAQKKLDAGFKDALARAKGNGELAKAVKEFYLASSAFFREATYDKKSAMESAADRLDMELKLAK